jgi:phage shock protein PspC (stress-responsive transcriptional regulator)
MMTLYTVALVVLLSILAVRMSNRGRPLYRNHEDQQLQGLCAGVAHAAEIPVALPRILCLVLFIANPGPTFWLYLIASLCVPWKRAAEAAATV